MRPWEVLTPLFRDYHPRGPLIAFREADQMAQRHIHSFARNGCPLFNAMEVGDGAAVVIPPSPEAVVGSRSGLSTKTFDST